MDDMQSRIAARRAEIERERADAAAAAKAAEAERQAQASAAKEREWVDRARAEKGRIGEDHAPGGTVDPRSREAADRMIREAVWNRWTDNQRKGVGATVAAGILLLFFNPVWGVIVSALGVGMYAAVRSKHRDAVYKEYPDLFPTADEAGTEPTLWQKLWWKPEPPK